MTRKLFILFLFALVLAGCSTTQPLCIDDAYHWQDKTPTTQTTPSTQNTQNTQNTPSSEAPAPSSPSLEFLNVQDTTVTVRINR